MALPDAKLLGDTTLGTIQTSSLEMSTFEQLKDQEVSFQIISLHNLRSWNNTEIVAEVVVQMFT